MADFQGATLYAILKHAGDCFVEGSRNGKGFALPGLVLYNTHLLRGGNERVDEATVGDIVSQGCFAVEEQGD